MKLTQLLKPWISENTADCSIAGLKNDSRHIKPGDLFIAYPGAASDGRLFIQKAEALGAAAIVFDPENLPDTWQQTQSIPCIAIPDLSQKLAIIASKFYDNPSKSLTLTGITGTNGKTTIAYQLAQAHELLGQKSAYIGTLGQGQVNQLLPLDNTTPDGLCLQNLLNSYNHKAIQQVCVEVSSHALSQHRVDGIDFDQAIFTNLTQDHLDYHKTMESYGAAKANLFKLPSLEYAIINQDDAYHQIMSDALSPNVKKITYGIQKPSDVRVVNWHMDMNGTTIELHSPWGSHQLHVNSVGEFNIYNSLAIVTSLWAGNYTPSDVVNIMSQLKAAPGRLEIVSYEPYVIVDYAHTPDALENVLITLNQLKKGLLWVVFGCGGDRDKSKRAIMGSVAARHADTVVITSDNPRSENPQAIIEDIATGIPNSVQAITITNREEAIAYALERAKKEDIILIAGKGHEAYQQIGNVKHAFSDKLVVQKRMCQAE